MSAISEEVRTALYSAMNVSAVTDLATGGVHHKVIPQDGDYPAVTFTKLNSNVDYSFGPTLTMEDQLWMVKATADEDSDTSKEPQALCEEILAAIETAVGYDLTLATYNTRRIWRDGDIPELTETINDREVHTHGFLYRVSAN